MFQTDLYSRNTIIDILRFLGISLIILAHVNPPNYILNLRCFDVPMMLFVSGLAYSNKRSNFSISFIVHRIKRLIIPVYIFLSFYFIVVLAFKYFLKIDFGITKEHIVGSYLLMNGIGYVWIIRVFLLIGIITPILQKFNETKLGTWTYMCFILFFLLIQEIITEIGAGLTSIFIREYVYYMTGYSIIFMIGLRIMKEHKLWKWNIFGVSIFLLSACYIIIDHSSGGAGINISSAIHVNNYKYPPQTYFITYGIMMSLFIYAILKKNIFNYPRLFLLIGQNTIWIYLWHIPLIQLTGLFDINWITRYMIVYVLSVSVCMFQVFVVAKLEIKYPGNKFLKYLKG